MASMDDPLVTVSTAETIGKPIAEGAIVAQYPGGLTAIRINEDLLPTEYDTTAAAAVVDRTLDLVRPAAAAAATTPNQSATSGDYLGKVVVYPNGGGTGVVVAHRPPMIFCFSQKSSAAAAASPTHTDGLVQVLNVMSTLSVSPDLRNLDGFGEPLPAVVDQTIGTTTAATAAPVVPTRAWLPERSIFAPIPKVANIALINNAMLTGNTMMDVLAPVGRGQNMLLVGSDLTQLRGLAYDCIRTQSRVRRNGGDTKFVYAATDANREAAYQRLQQAGLAKLVHFVGTTTAATDPVSHAAEAVLVASAACAVGESYALNGQHALVIIDSIDQHKTLWDATTRVLVDVFGVDAVVQSDLSGGASSEMRAFYSSLIQRAGQYNKKLGGGSVTLLLLTSLAKVNEDDDATFEPSDFDQSSDRMKERIAILANKNIPLTAATLRKINIPIPTLSEGKRRMELQHIDDLISMSDGQVWLDDALALNGQQPPIDPQRSITRIGIGADTESRADAPAFRRIAEGMRLELSQAASMMEGSEPSKASQKQYRRQQAILLAMHQPTGSGGRRLSESCIVLLAARLGHLDESIDQGILPSSPEAAALIQALLDHVNRLAAGVMDDIDDSMDVSDEAYTVLAESISSFFASYTN
jgi:F0F1-type ATP synthase alpha subunit